MILRPLFVTAVLLSHLGLLLGMVRANRPWRLVGRLYAALIAALAVGAYGVVTSDIWRLSIALDWWRLTITSAVSITITVFQESPAICQTASIGLAPTACEATPRFPK